MLSSLASRRSRTLRHVCRQRRRRSRCSSKRRRRKGCARVAESRVFFALIKIITEVSKQDDKWLNIEDSTGRRCAGWRNTEVAPADWLHNFGLPLPLSPSLSPVPPARNITSMGCYNWFLPMFDWFMEPWFSGSDFSSHYFVLFSAHKHKRSHYKIAENGEF